MCTWGEPNSYENPKRMKSSKMYFWPANTSPSSDIHIKHILFCFRTSHNYSIDLDPKNLARPDKSGITISRTKCSLVQQQHELNISELEGVVTRRCDTVVTFKER